MRREVLRCFVSANVACGDGNRRTQKLATPHATITIVAREVFYFSTP